MAVIEVKHRTTVVVTVVIGYGLVVAVAALALVGGFDVVTSIPGALGLASFAAVAPTLAVLSLRGRPLLLLAAGLAGIATVPILSLFGLVLAVLGIVWIIVFASNSTDTPTGRALKMLIPLILLGCSGFALLAHVDPVCERHFEDGSTERFDPSESGMQSGWVWDTDTSAVSGSGSSQPGETLSECASDRVVWPEALVSVAFAAACIGVAWRLAAVER